VLSEIFDHLLVLEPAEDKVTSLLLQIHASVKLSSKIIGGACCTLGKDYVKQNQQAILAMVFSKLLDPQSAIIPLDPEIIVRPKALHKRNSHPTIPADNGAARESQKDWAVG